jgi:hypothetical protein
VTKTASGFGLCPGVVYARPPRDGVERLTDFLDIGHAVQNTARQSLGFSLQEAIDYLRTVEIDDV